MTTFSALPAIFLFLGYPCASRAVENQIQLQYLNNGDQGTALALATDPSGNFFTVSTIVDESGRGLMRINKLDPSGNPLASFDFGSNGTPAAAATDAQGNLIVVGTANSTGFPLVAPLFASVNGTSAFVMKINSQLTSVLFSTLLINQSTASAVALDSTGNIYVVGYGPPVTITPGAYRTSAAGAFIMEISSNGTSLLLATQFGGSMVSCTGGSACIGASAYTQATVVAIDPSGAIVFAGNTTALDLPVTPGVVGPVCQCTYNSGSGFVAKLSPGGSQLEWSTYTNATQSSPYHSLAINALALDATGNVLIGGAAPGFQTTAGTFQAALPADAQWSGFLAKLNPAASQFIWSTYMGGNQSGQGISARVDSIAVNASGQIAITGYSDPTLLPSVTGVTYFGDTYSAWISSDGSTITSLYVGADQATGQALVLTSSGTLSALGRAGSLWIENSGAGPSLFSTATAALGPVSSLIAPYELFSFYGAGIGPQTPLDGQAVNGAFTTSLGGYTVMFNGIPAPLLYSSSAQVNTIVPSELAGQDSARLAIVTPTGTINGPILNLRQAQPYIFTNSATGLSAALNQDGTLNSPQNPATPGSVVTIYATGGAPFLWSDGQIVPTDHFLNSRVPVSVLAGPNGLTSMEVDYAGDAPGLVAGVMQINFRLPASTSPLTTFSFQLEVANVLGGSGTVAVSP
jgi:uncharacterized protein (TIGR03437 family)